MTSLRELREAQGLSQTALARRADVSPDTVLNIERHGLRPDPGTRRSLAKAPGVEVDQIDWPAPAVSDGRARG